MKNYLTSDQIEEIFSRWKIKYNDPKIELDYTSTYTLLVAVVLSAQSTDKRVNIVTKELFEIADTPEKMVALGEENLKKYIATIGLTNSKAKNIIALSLRLIEHFNSEVPSNREDLESLPGVGRKSANVILNCVFNHPTIAVDTHIFRISNRIGFCAENTPVKVEQALYKIIPNKWHKFAHFAMVLHGRYICKARTPNCSQCIINDICQKRGVI